MTIMVDGLLRLIAIRPISLRFVLVCVCGLVDQTETEHSSPISLLSRRDSFLPSRLYFLTSVKVESQMSPLPSFNESMSTALHTSFLVERFLLIVFRKTEKNETIAFISFLSPLKVITQTTPSPSFCIHTNHTVKQRVDRK